jgi:hypothetical protein
VLPANVLLEAPGEVERALWQPARSPLALRNRCAAGRVNRLGAEALHHRETGFPRWHEQGAQTPRPGSQSQEDWTLPGCAESLYQSDCQGFHSSELRAGTPS